mmetsp:Transcript_18357/g.20216  ORF Transcript_18357/g.20216 Transcript_18357/m.20216 type:complete len:137 (+) Transcript_18357:233-643(+)
MLTMMQTIIAVFVTILATSSAFAPMPQTTVDRVATISLSMAVRNTPDVIKKGMVATVALAVPTVFTSVAALATEGTNEWFGVDDTRLLAVLFVVHWGILTLYLKEYGNADEEEDFFGEIDYTHVRTKDFDKKTELF